MKERMTYAARIYEDEYGFIAEFPQLGLVTQGKDINEVLHMAADALETHFLDYSHDEDLPPQSDFNIELRPGDIKVIISVYVDPMADYDLTTHEVMQLLGVNKQRIAQLRSLGKVAARKVGRDYLHSRSDVDTIRCSKRRAGRPCKISVAV